MFAWRRANVTELNHLARKQMVAHGRVQGPELVTPGGIRYAAGDRVIALAPMVRGQIVTSERGVVTEVDLEEQRLMVETENGRRFQLEQEAIATQLAHGYATTVHRSQGATYDIAHVLEDGGGRELAYVAMSRARERTDLYLVADDLGQAREDLARHWQQERRDRWAIDTGTPQPGGDEVEPPEPAAIRKLALEAERDALRVAIPRSLEPHLEMAESELRWANRDLENHRRDRGRHSEGELGDVAGELWWARHHAWNNQRTAEHRELGWRTRREARHHEAEYAERVASAEERLEKLLAVEEAKLIEALDRAKEKVSDLNQEIGHREQWLDDHPRANAQLQHLSGQVIDLDREDDHERWTVEGELNPRPAPTPRIERSRSRDDDDYRSIGRDNDRGYGFGR